MRVLVVDDDEVSAELLRHALEEYGYDVTTAFDGRQAFELVRTGEYRMVVTDWEMPNINGLELCRLIREKASSGYIYIILLTSNSGTQNIVQGLEAGADDYIVKPFQPEELSLRLSVGQRVLSLESRDLIIFSLAKLADSRDPQTGAHLERMREYSKILASHLSTLPEYRDTVDGDFVQLIYLTSPLHDIGKVGIPDQVLLKPGKLTTEEFEIMKQHTIIGGETLDAAVASHPEARFLRMARDIAWTHHERFDGTGYPHGLSGYDIPLSGRIVAVADVYDALTSSRVYKPAYSHETAKEIIVEGRGTHFDPAIVDAFLATESQFIEVAEQLETADLFMKHFESSAMR